MGERQDEMTAGSQFGAGANPGRDPDTGKDAAKIRADIERTRSEMGETIDALQERLSPQRIKSEVKERVRDATIGRAERAMDSMSRKVSDMTRDARNTVRDTGSSIIDTIKDNPVPFALIGAGIGMLTYRLRRRDENDYYGARREYSRGYYEPEAYTQYGDEGHDEGDGSSLADRARDRARNLTGRAREGAGELSDKARYAADRTREQVSRVSGEVRDRARRAGGGVRDTFYSNPLAVGAAVLAAGAALGLAVPTSRAEREYMGEARDQFVDKAESAARDAMDKVRNVAREAGRTAQEEAKNQGLTGS